MSGQSLANITPGQSMGGPKFGFGLEDGSTIGRELRFPVSRLAGAEPGSLPLNQQQGGGQADMATATG